MPAIAKTLQHKTDMYNTATNLFSTHKNFMLMSIKRVQATQLKNVKAALDDRVKLLIAKNKIVRKVLLDLDATKYAELIDMLKGDVVLAFFDGVDPKSIFEACENNMRKALAIPGDCAPTDVIIPAGPTGLGPEKINIFQAAKIGTKINKGLIDLALDHKLFVTGDLVTFSDAKLLSMLRILPFEFGLNIIKIFEGSEVYSKDLLKITEEDTKNTIHEAIALLASISLGSSTTSEVSVPYEIRNAFADIVKISLASGFKIQEFSN
ncbi:uncharacterized protein LOC143922000 [Arctopsyche grandis]|uniref:uncharacterized protein LOC143922000 n=1 Tax=Arctopsyche grandis TaxID=121162 RepID=UPI00406D6C4C